MAGEKIRVDDIVDGTLPEKGRNDFKPLEWVDTHTVKISATADMPAKFHANGLYGGKDIGYYLGTSDKRLMVRAADTSMDFAASGLDAGVAKADNWYGIFAIDNAGAFTLKAVTFIKVKADAAHTIDCGTHVDASVATGYSWTTDIYQGASLLVLTGALKGTARTIVNNTNSAGASQIVYDSTDLGLTQGDWVMIAPAGATYYRYVGSIYSVSASTMLPFYCENNYYHWNSSPQFLQGLVGAWGSKIFYASISPLGYSCDGYVELTGTEVGVNQNQQLLLGYISGATYYKVGAIGSQNYFSFAKLPILTPQTFYFQLFHAGGGAWVPYTYIMVVAYKE